jgi:thymidine phosphorylase
MDSGAPIQEIIRRKRDGVALSEAEIEYMVRGLTDGSVSEGQVAAFAMAVVFRGLIMEERVVLTRAMTRSGRVLDWRDADLPGPALDKHSTGGVGDKVSLMLAPIVAACGGAVPMISGRGLGHTGGTADKLDSIPGYATTPDIALFRAVVREVGCAIIGPTADLAPADRRLYAIRDVTATVESIPLITASILSKKLAAGLDALVMDVKFGSGAFMPAFADAADLARSILEVATGAGLPTTALLTDMNQVLGTTAGHALEVREAIDYLTGAAREPRLHELTSALSAELLVHGGLARDHAEALARVDSALASGEAAERFQSMVARLGGPGDLVARPDHYLPRAPEQVPVRANSAGYVIQMDVRAIGLTVMALGGGRRRADDPIDPAVGLSAVCGLGAELDSTRPLAIVHARSRADADRATAMLQAAITIGDRPPGPLPVVRQRIAAGCGSGPETPSAPTRSG